MCEANRFKYLGSVRQKNNSSEEDMKNRIKYGGSHWMLFIISQCINKIEGRYDNM